MISKAQIKHIRSLGDKKYRNSCHSFVVETPKFTIELLRSHFFIKQLYATEKWIDENRLLLQQKKIEPICVADFELEKISFLQTPNQVLCEVEIPEQTLSRQSVIDNSIILVLDTIQDPGNLGTIIRTADWFGINTIFCSHETVDAYGPKIVQATMGSILRTSLIYTDIVSLVQHTKNDIYVTALNGQNCKDIRKIKKGIIVIGNEGKGVREEIIQLAKYKISIAGKGKTESLNAAVATGIICSHLLA